MGLIKELNQVIHDLSFHRQQYQRDHYAHFCEHDGICINFTQARRIWHAMAPCAIKPWWLVLNPVKQSVRQTTGTNDPQKKKYNKITKDSAEADITEVTEDA